MKKLVFILVMTICMGGMTFALDFMNFSDALEPGELLISPGFKFGFYYGVVLGATVGIDYTMDIGFPVTVGGEFGIIKPVESPMLAVPVIARAAYHPDIGVSNLDFYLTLKAGAAFGFMTGDYVGPNKTSIDFSFGGNVGCRYFFYDKTAVFLEGGYDYYPMPHWYVQTFVTAGLTFKL
jgi:hypothetical protein